MIVRDVDGGADEGDDGLARILAQAVAQLGSAVTLVLHPAGTEPAEAGSPGAYRVPIGSSRRLCGDLVVGHGDGELDGLARAVAEDVAKLVGERLRADERRGILAIERMARIRMVLESRCYEVWHQPIVDLRTGRRSGVEGLLRFLAPGPSTPDGWFAEAAAVGLGADLELAAVAAVLDTFPMVEPDAYLSVNVSPDVVVMPAFARLLDRADPGRLVLELTEHAAVTDYPRLRAVLASLRRRGVLVAVDDVGAGFANMRHVLELAPDVLKLDASLTSGIDTDPRLASLSRSIATFARSMNMAVVAEGVETAAELDVLREIGVAYGQGFHLCEPAPVAARQAATELVIPTSAG